jgi:choice-of-anchor C domain-containing protein
MRNTWETKGERCMNRSITFALAALALAFQPAWATSIVQNGSFETYTGGDVGSFVTLSVGNTQITGWTVIKGVYAAESELGGIDYIGTIWTAADGARSLDLDNLYATGGVEQPFDTVPGAPYCVTFALAGNPAGGPVVKQVRVSGGASTQDYSFDITGKSFTNMGWVTEHFYFTAPGSTTTLKFQSLSPSGCAYGAALDNVTVEVIPEPLTMASGLLAVSALGMYLRKRTRV